ncbi:hypothetical protein [Mycolicibacterium wolinskyi]|uniref:hypothetical protein n=1 Tax=Mycolicibacterium wolinskyi TaxID=59750 RepID=UPI003BAA6875
MASYTQELLKQGGFEYDWHSSLGGDIRVQNDDSPGCWDDMRVTLERVRDGSCRSDEWDAPLGRKYADIGEVKRKRARRHYRLYVTAERDRPGVLLLLHFAWKPGGKKGLEVQNGHIDEAFNRLMDWHR